MFTKETLTLVKKGFLSSLYFFWLLLSYFPHVPMHVFTLSVPLFFDSFSALMFSLSWFESFPAIRQSLVIWPFSSTWHHFHLFEITMSKCKHHEDQVSHHDQLLSLHYLLPEIHWKNLISIVPEKQLFSSVLSSLRARISSAKSFANTLHWKWLAAFNWLIVDKINDISEKYGN